MRDIIFRGKASKDWIYGSLIYVKREYDSFCCILENEDSGRYDYPYLDADLGVIDGKATPVDPSTIGQYTGLLDKNGDMIFEGDIVKDEYGKLKEVRFIFGRYVPFNSYPEYNCWNAAECEIFGNIHDNSEEYTKQVNRGIL